MTIDYSALWSRVAQPTRQHTMPLHGPDHWRRVERNGLLLARRTGADEDVVRLFALFHDAARIHDGWDDGHGARGAALACSLRGVAFQFSDERFALLQYACTWHTDQNHHPDPTIGTCWDADRLDLGRVGVIPDPDFLNTDFAKEIARAGSIVPYLQATGLA
jgi:uncharacterized protein